jgi:orotidine-5'-phosphate decarboxylase
MVLADARDRLIVALDVNTKDDAIALIDRLGDVVSFYKVGLQLFLGDGYQTIRELHARGKKVFLDLKIEDVPETVKLAIRNMEAMGTEFFTIKGNGATTRAALDARGADKEFPKFLQLTVLSSWDQADLDEYLCPKGGQASITVEDFAVYWGRKVKEAGCDGLIASGASIRKLRDEFGDKVIIVAPGIRPAGTFKDDHKRSTTPFQAIIDGADYLVVGRPIRNSADPRETAEDIIQDIKGALEAIENSPEYHKPRFGRPFNSAVDVSK